MQVVQNHQFIKLNSIIEQLWKNEIKREAIYICIELANEIMHILGVPRDELKSGDDVLDQAYPNAKFKNQKMELWFEKHPYLGNARIALYHYNKGSFPVESNIYQLTESATKARISATTQLTTNWEDSILTMLPDYKIGIDFFLNTDGKSVLMVVTDKGNLRVLELSERLSNTQIEIFGSIKNSLIYNDLEPDSNKFLEHEPQKTIHKKIWNSFELQEVNKKFYSGVAELFTELNEFLKLNPPTGISINEVENESKLFATRLLGRLHFLWFLRKKGIISDQKEYFLTDGMNSTSYYEDKLKILFFSILNTPIKERKTDDYTTPYLNGGLFDPHKNDWIDRQIKFPKTWFGRLYNHFNNFNFTTDESSPEYEQIAIDPEMLGRVFENLLASIVPETSKKANERNKMGAFYTPREIVAYMNKEVLKSYLKNYLDNEKDEYGVDQLIDMNDAKYIEQKSTGALDLWGKRSDEIQEKLIEALNKLKILDPACGSGAFPIGLLQILVRTYERLSAIYDEKEKKHIPARSRQVYSAYNTKLSIIENNLFGSDIEPMAIEIAKLRSWLSLIIDDYGKIEPLPNLDFNFVCTNSLIPLDYSQIGILVNFDYEEEFEKLRSQYFSIHESKDKEIIKKKFSRMYNTEISEVEGYKRLHQLKSWNPFETNQPAEFFDAKTMFNIDGFDIVIGNPPYIHLENIREESKNLYKPLNYKTYAARGDIYTLFYEMGVTNLKDNGYLCYITSNKWMRAGYGSKLRDYLVLNTNPKQLIDLGAGVFNSATVDTNILLLKKGPYTNKTKVVTIDKVSRKMEMAEYIKNNSSLIKFDIKQPWSVLNQTQQTIKSKIESVSIPLGELQGIKLKRGIITGFNEAFIIDEETKREILENCSSVKEKNRTNEIIVPVIRGRDIKRNSYEWAKIYVIYAYNGINEVMEEDYPSLYLYLSKYKTSLIKRAQCRYLSNGKTNSPKDKDYPGFVGMHHWLELDNNPKKESLNEFSKTKIFWSDISTEPSFVKVDETVTINNTAYMITGGPNWLIDYLNSDIVKWYFPLIATDLGEKGTRYFKQFVEKIPVPNMFDNKLPFKNYGFTKEEIQSILSSNKEV